MRRDFQWLLARWRAMVLIRAAEEAIAGLVSSGEARCPCHLCIGQEAVAAGVCAALNDSDSIWGGHRSHGHYLAKGGSLEKLFAEILGRATGCSGGRGGSMHLLDADRGLLGTVPIVAATVPLAAGAALAYKMRREPRVAVAFFGDGALEEGSVHETFNLASLYRLPLIFVCENNLYASHLHWSERRRGDRLDQAGAFHSVPGERVDGNDVEAVYRAAAAAVERARAGAGPSLIECRTFRWRGHVGASLDLDVGVKRRGEIAEWLRADPIARCEERLRALGRSASLDEEKDSIRDQIARALDAARRAPEPDPARVSENVWISSDARGPAPRRPLATGGARQLSYAEAIREAHAQLLARDPRVFLAGQGLWSPWYAGGSLEHLERDFSSNRILDSPVSENAVTGMAVGAALAGMRPIVFHPRMDFLLLAADPVINQAANWSYLFHGRIGVPLVIRAVINRGGEQGAQHSQALHALFMHIPGLKVVMPATPADAKGLLIAAAEDPNPVLYIDDRWLYTQTGPVPEDMTPVPIGKAAIARRGRDVTIVAVSWMVEESLRAASQLASEGLDAEVIDLRSLKPWDQETVLESVRKTGAAVVADPGWRTAGASAEIAATISEAAFASLRFPVARVTLPDVPAPASRAEEQAYYTGAAQIAACARRVARRAGPVRARKEAYA